MTKILTIILVFIGPIAFGQIVQIETFRLEKSGRFEDIQLDKMNFPIVQSENQKIDSLINNDLKNRFTNNEYPNATMDSALIKWADGQIIFLDFTVTFNQNGILSINVSAEGCGAYCTYWTEYFNYSTKTGKWLDISDIIDTTGTFKKMVFEDKVEQYNKARRNLKENHKDSNWGLSEDDYENTLEYFNECDNSFKLNQYALYADHIEIIEECWLPHVMKPSTPIIELKYKFSEIREYLKIKN
ncbi:hypothetical protein M3O96_14015 [Aquiflexum sp. TKW24L]|uniref:hypothetical protein n=1 Tax=Aquiflexum sp. TKW24L TaxID=2942212 RepID=UPI0020BF9F56|nr:hypothetical protein [Aquiflexum sp. TKW24L]MCL6260212.1 hypothetical protein [Aquiflexum sp. TKW24L]